MLVLIVGLVLFLGVHFIRVLPGAREHLAKRFGEAGYKIAYTVVSLLGFGLIIWGVMLSRPSMDVWVPPTWGAKRLSSLCL